MERFFRAGLFLGTIIVAAVACGQSSSDGDSSAQDVSSGATCTVIAMKDGHTMTAAELAQLNDPIANFVLKGQGCPTTFSDIQAKLVKTDPCGKNDPGLSTRLVTDRAQLLDAPDSYRAVVKRACQGRTDHELFMSVFGIDTQVDDQKKVTQVDVPPTTLELIGEQKSTAGGVTSGVFNFYAREDNQWKFFGSSADFVQSGYECNADGACIPKAATKQRCASCHVGGGLVMKELQSPWVNWEGAFNSPGADDVIQKNPLLFGAKGNGVDLEGSVETGNKSDWIPTRVRLLKKAGLKEVLRPLFCSTDMNLQSPGVPFLGALATNADVFPSPAAPTPGPAQYTAALGTAHQRIVDGRTGKPLVGPKGPVLDTRAGFTFPSLSTQDSDYVKELQNQQIVDIDFVKDVLIVDFSRPLYSPTRCKMLDAMPDVAEGDMHFDKVKAAVVAKLAGTQDPALSQLLANLKDPTDAGLHDLAVTKFGQACAARFKADPAGYTLDLVRYASHVRKAAKRARNATNGGIIEFAETLPVDDLPEATSGLDPATCKLP